MKQHNYLLFFLVYYCVASCSPRMAHTKDLALRNFLYKTELDTSINDYGVHIEVKQILPNTEELIPMSIDDREKISRSKYTRDDEIKILGEYLTFRGDTSISNKQYKFKASGHMVRPEGIKVFTIQIEALFSFTRMLTQGLPPIKPMLINRATGEELNANSIAVNEVYAIYVKWYNEHKKTDFTNITWPLAGTSYGWLGEDKNIDSYLKKSF